MEVFRIRPMLNNKCEVAHWIDFLPLRLLRQSLQNCVPGVTPNYLSALPTKVSLIPENQQIRNCNQNVSHESGMDQQNDLEVGFPLWDSSGGGILI